MTTRKSCPRKGATFFVGPDNPVIATGKCKHGRVEVATINSGVIELTRSNLKVTRGKKRDAAHAALMASGSPVAAALAESARSGRAMPAKAVEAMVTRELRHPVTTPGSFDPSTGLWSHGSMLWTGGPAPRRQAAAAKSAITYDAATGLWTDGRTTWNRNPMASAASAPASMPEAWQYMHAGEARGALPSDWRSRESFEGLSGVGDLSGSPAEHEHGYTRNAEFFDRAYRSMKEDLDSGDCEQAFDSLRRAVNASAGMMVHAQNAPQLGKTAFDEGFTLQMAAANRYYKKCVHR